MANLKISLHRDDVVGFLNLWDTNMNTLNKETQKVIKELKKSKSSWRGDQRGGPVREGGSGPERVTARARWDKPD